MSDVETFTVVAVGWWPNVFMAIGLALLVLGMFISMAWAYMADNHEFNSKKEQTWKGIGAFGITVFGAVLVAVALFGFNLENTAYENRIVTNLELLGYENVLIIEPSSDAISLEFIADKDGETFHGEVREFTRDPGTYAVTEYGGTK